MEICFRFFCSIFTIINIYDTLDVMEYKLTYKNPRELWYIYKCYYKLDKLFRVECIGIPDSTDVGLNLDSVDHNLAKKGNLELKNKSAVGCTMKLFLYIKGKTHPLERFQEFQRF